ncbi:MAG: hypothetical protein WBP22_00375 [Candidatus Saccharimonas sp.]
MNTMSRPTNGKLIYDIIPPKAVLASRASTSAARPVAHLPAKKPLLYADILAELASFPDFQEPKLLITRKDTSSTKKETLRKLAIVSWQAANDFIRDINWRAGIPAGRFVIFSAILFISMTASFTTLKALSEGSSNTAQDSKPSSAEKVHSDTVKPATAQSTDTTSKESATTPAANPTAATTAPTQSSETTPVVQSTPQQSSTPQTSTQPTGESTTGTTSGTNSGTNSGTGTTSGTGSGTSSEPNTNPSSETTPPSETTPTP